ncbi:MAG TPA: oligosaccharide flippase family protein [Chondromyces sp.]|nr:oligosaccharide flippase family protein [Chondromyces sp.]
MNSFLKGTVLLVSVAFAGECLELLTNVILTRELGEHGMGRYMSILPSIFLVVILASFELPISLSKLIAEKEKEYHKGILSYTIKIAWTATAILIAMVGLAFLLIPAFQEIEPVIRLMIILLIPIISFSSVARGYFMGIQKMRKIAIANFLRKVAQLGLLVLFFRLYNFDGETALLTAICTLIASEFIVFIYLFHSYYFGVRQLKRAPAVLMKEKEMRKRLLGVSLPTTGMRIFHAVSNAVEPMIIKAALVAGGLSATAATEQFGTLTGVAFTIGFFPAFIAHSLLIMLIPTVAERFSRQDISGLVGLLKKVIGFTFLYGVPIIVGLYVWAEELAGLFVPSIYAAYFVKLCAPYFLFHYLSLPLQAFMIGLGLVKDAFIHLVLSTMMQFALIYYLGATHDWQMAGVIIGMNAGALLLLLLHLVTVVKKLDLTIVQRKTTNGHRI